MPDSTNTGIKNQTPSGRERVVGVVYEEKPGGLLAPSHYHEVPSLEDVPNGATVFRIDYNESQEGPDGLPIPPRIWSDVCP